MKDEVNMSVCLSVCPCRGESRGSILLLHNDEFMLKTTLFTSKSEEKGLAAGLIACLVQGVHGDGKECVHSFWWTVYVTEPDFCVVVAILEIASQQQQQQQWHDENDLLETALPSTSSPIDDDIAWSVS